MINTSFSPYPLFTMKHLLLRLTALGLCLTAFAMPVSAAEMPSGVKKIKDVIIYEDPLYYAAFPSVIKNKKTGDFVVAFRRAPDRRALGEKKNYHVDSNSYLVTVSSKDGETWSKEPQLLYAHALGGSQDPCILQLRDGTLITMSYGWSHVREDGVPNLKKPYFENLTGFMFLGGYGVRSTDGGKTWEGPYYPPHIPVEKNRDPYGKFVPAYNRGALVEGKNGRVYWVAAAIDSLSPRKSSTHLLVSDDKGKSWTYSAPVGVDDKVTFNETSIYETPKGDLVAFMRTADFNDHATLARSTDGGKTFQPWQDMGFKGHPLQALRLPDDRVLLVYGYRHPPYGIRARILNAECTDYATAPEMILREDGGTTDIGYPWSVQLDKKLVLVTYYYNVADGTRHIAGTILEIK